MVNSLQIQKLKDLMFIESQKGNLTFTWNGSSYTFNPSATEFNRQAEFGGFEIVRLLTATVRLYDIDQCNNMTPLFTNGIPQPQQKIIYSLDGVTYRVDSVRKETTGAYFRLTAHSTTKIY